MDHYLLVIKYSVPSFSQNMLYFGMWDDEGSTNADNHALMKEHFSQRGGTKNGKSLFGIPHCYILEREMTKEAQHGNIWLFAHEGKCSQGVTKMEHYPMTM